MELVTGRVERYHGDQLVVDLGDLDLVRKELEWLGVAAEYIDKDDRLGLARFALPRLSQERDELFMRARLADGKPDQALDRRVHDAIGRAERNRADDRLSPELPGLDLLLIVLRARFAYWYDGWSPTIGKHRLVELVKGYPLIGGGAASGLGGAAPTPHIGGGGSGDPEPADPPAAFKLDASELAHQAQIGRGIRVAVLDTGLWLHPFLVGRFIALPGTTVSATPTIPWVTAGHATFVSGLVLVRAPGAQLEVHRVLDDRALGDAWDAARKIAEVAASRVHVINLSWGCYTDDGQAPLVLARAVDRLAPEIVVVASAGDHADVDRRVPRRFPGDERLTPQTPTWPAAFDRVTAVGATEAGQLASFSPRTPWVDLLAPGVDVESTYLTGKVRSEHVHEQGGAFDFVAEALPKPFTGFARWSGTSFAAAAVSGQVAADATSGAGGVPQALERLLRQSYGARTGSDIRPFTLDDLNGLPVARGRERLAPGEKGVEVTDIPRPLASRMVADEGTTSFLVVNYHKTIADMISLRTTEDWMVIAADSGIPLTILSPDDVSEFPTDQSLRPFARTHPPIITVSSKTSLEDLLRSPALRSTWPRIGGIAITSSPRLYKVWPGQRFYDTIRKFLDGPQAFSRELDTAAMTEATGLAGRRTAIKIPRICYYREFRRLCEAEREFIERPSRPVSCPNPHNLSPHDFLTTF